MKWTPLIVASLTVMASGLIHADPGGQPNGNSKKTKKSVQSEKQGADRWRTLWIGGYRADSGGVEESERWRREKAQAHRDEKARRDLEAHERLTREEARRSATKAKQDREKLAGEQRRDAKKAASDRRQAADRANKDKTKRTGRSR